MGKVDQGVFSYWMLAHHFRRPLSYVGFGGGASTRPMSERLVERYSEFRWVDLDIRDADGVMRVFGDHARELELIVHTAAQPSHDWAAGDPQTDFSVNADGTLNLLEAA